MSTEVTSTVESSDAPEGDSGAQQATSTATFPRQVLQRVVLPRDADPLDARLLYLDEPSGVNCKVASRTAVRVPEAAKVSFGSYFNAFPAGYWNRWSRLSDVLLRMRVRGHGRIEVFHSRWHGEMLYTDGRVLRSDDWTELEFRVDLGPFSDGGWIWFDASTEDSSLEIADAAWCTDAELDQARIAVGTTTFNRPDDCVATLNALASDDAVMARVSHVFVADQGNRTVRENPGFAAVAEALGDKLRVIEQDNIGGSGGFTRAMYESLEHTDVEQVLLLDDDIFLEPDSVLRASSFASAAASPVIVGGQMLNLQARSRLHTTGEVIDLNTADWGPAPGAVMDHDFKVEQLRYCRPMHKRVDANYNGWWMTLFPREVIERIGLPLPLFIKWDDAEYGLRAAEAGYPTVTLPGAAVWHMPWTNKNDNFDWTLYFHRRNRLISTAIHGADPRRAVIKIGLLDVFRRLLSMEYSSVAMELKAVEDFLAGPEGLFDSLRTGLPEVQKVRAQYADAQLKGSAQEFPPPILEPRAAEGRLALTGGKWRHRLIIAKAVRRSLRPVDPQAMERPEVNVPAEKVLWVTLGNLDSATVSLPDGRSVAWRKRDPKTFKKLALRAVRTYRRFGREWPAKVRQYQEALPDLTSVEAWRKVYGG